MPLGLADGPFVPLNLISTQESPAPLLKFQMVPRLKILMCFRYTFSFLSKITENEPPPRSPTEPLWREIPVYRAF